MAKLIIDNVEYDVNDGHAIDDACQEAGIPYDCNTGVCGSCLIQILEGSDNLSALTQEEQDFGLDGQQRLACQCKILKGTVKITF